MRGRCIGFGRVIDTDQPIAGTLPTADADGAAIRVAWHPAMASPAEERPVWCRMGDVLWFDPPGVARYRCTADGIAVTPIAGAAPDLIDALLVATALPAVMWLQGAVVLHAAAVVPRGAEGALAIAGASGVGKSHLAAALLADGARLVADDSIAVDCGGDRAVCAGLAGGYHLGAPGEEIRAFHRVPQRDARRSAPLDAIVVLGDDDTPPERLTGTRAVAALLANRHRASVARVCGAEARVLGDVVRLARAVQVYRWPRQEADALLDEAVRGEIMRDGDGG